MATDLKVIALKLDQLVEVQKTSAEKLTDVRERLYNPDEGIYARMKDIHAWTEQHEQTDEERHKEFKTWTKDHEEDDAALRKSVVSMAKTMEPLVDDYKLRISRRKWTDKILWAVIAGILAVVVPLGWSAITTPDSAPAKVEHKHR